MALSSPHRPFSGTYQLSRMEIKQGIRRNFARRAASYDCYAEVQRFMAQQLLAQADAAIVQASRIMEVGCGTGYLTTQLRHVNPRAHLVAVDLDEVLLEWARSRMGPDPRAAYVLADGEAISGKNFDLIISNSTFQWFTHPETTISDYFRILNPGGCLAFSTLGPGTFSELATAMWQAGKILNLNKIPGIPAAGFLRAEYWTRLLAQAGFHSIQVSHKPLTIKFPTVINFLKALQATGATNPQPRPFSPRLLTALITTYKALFGENASIPVTYEVIWIVAGRQDIYGRL
jgi:malonyl-CoA O-methyltransferase